MKTFYEFCLQKMEATAMSGETISPNTADLFRNVAAELQTKIAKSKVPEKAAQDAITAALGSLQSIAATTGDKAKTPSAKPTTYTPPRAGAGMVGGIKPTT